jgi:hypothetical protein
LHQLLVESGTIFADELGENFCYNARMQDGQLANVLQEKVPTIKLFTSERNLFRTCTLHSRAGLQVCILRPGFYSLGNTADQFLRGKTERFWLSIARCTIVSSIVS